jgi:hypothetical protein
MNPYRVLVLLLFHDYEFASWDCDKCTVRTADLGRLLRVQSCRIREYAKWLADHGYITNLQMDHGWFSFTAVQPMNLADEFSGSGIEFVLDETPVRDDPVTEAPDEAADSDVSRAGFDPLDPFQMN